MKLIRAFIAIDLPDEVKRTLSDAQEQLSPSVPAGVVRWVKPEAMHLTLRFLGKTNEQLLPSIGRAMDEALVSTPAFSLRSGRLSVFPNRNRPRTIVLTVYDEAPTPGEGLIHLRSQLDAALETLRIAPDSKPLSPHLTLGRVRRDQSLATVPDVSVPDIAFIVSAVHLIESDLRPDGPEYTVRHTTRLATGR